MDYDTNKVSIEMSSRNNLYIGTCSWKYPEWSIYPENSDKKNFNFLNIYSQHFNTVEIDQWFWSLYSPTNIRMPNPKVVEEYASSVPDDFRFTIKAPNAITLTHFYSSGPQAKQYPEHAGKSNPYFLSVDLVHDLVKNLEPMKTKIGMIMFEFEYLNKQKMSTADEFIERMDSFLRELPKGYRYGVEIRNPNYLKKEFQSLLLKHSASFVLLHGYFMPSAWDVQKKIDLLYFNPLVIRAHGTDRSAIEEKTNGVWNNIVIDRSAELEKIADVIKKMIVHGNTVYANINNHFEGCAPMTIERLKKILQE